ncbi:MAG: ABC transporter permease [Mycoplasmatales bacterium]
MRYLRQIWSSKYAIHKMAVQKIKVQYSDQILGIFWAIVNPLIYIFTLWFAFTSGAREARVIDGVYPYIVWLGSGVLCWRFISSSIVMAPKVIKANSALVKTVKFPVMNIPIIEVLKDLYVHMVVIIIVGLLFIPMAGWEYGPSIYYLNFIYYWFMILIFLVGVSLILCTLGVLVTDVKSFVSAITLPLLWVQPIMWELSDTGKAHFLIKFFDPFYYYIEGYRDTIVYHRWFFTDPLFDIYNWLIIFVIYFVGITLWKNTRELMPDLI